MSQSTDAQGIPTPKVGEVFKSKVYVTQKTLSGGLYSLSHAFTLFTGCGGEHFITTRMF